MKQKKTIITLLLVAVVLGLGIAYAAVTSQLLTINGTAGVSSDDTPVNVVFTNAEVTSKPTTVSESDVTATIDTDATKATLHVSNFKTKNDTAVFEYTITNKHTDIAITLKDVTITLTGQGQNEGTSSGWFEVTQSLANTSLTANNAGGDLATSSTVLTITVKLKETPVTTEQVAAAKDTIKITINAEPVETSVESN